MVRKQIPHIKIHKLTYVKMQEIITFSYIILNIPINKYSDI